MPSSRQLISSSVLESTAATVTFSGIPSTYTDLVLRVSARSADAGIDEALQVTFNSDSATNYSRTYVRGSGSAVAGFRNSDQTLLQLSQAIVGNGSTASTFGNMEIYIPNYQSSSNKPVSATTTSENMQLRLILQHMLVFGETLQQSHL